MWICKQCVLECSQLCWTVWTPSAPQSLPGSKESNTASFFFCAAGKFWKHMVAATNHRLVDYLQNIWPKMAKRNQALETALKHYL